MSFFTFHKSDRRVLIVLSTLATVAAVLLLTGNMPRLSFDAPQDTLSTDRPSGSRWQPSATSPHPSYHSSRRRVDAGPVISEVEADSLRRLYGEARDSAPRPSAKFSTLTLVDINTADSALLCRIPGVGAKTASRIIRLRERLGGYYSVNQLMGVYNFNPEVLNWCKVGDASSVHQLNINTATFRELNAHPYISYSQTCDLMNRRRTYGNFKDKDDLLSTAIFTAEEVERLLPYITF